MSYVLNVRCRDCERLYRAGTGHPSNHPAGFYNQFAEFLCPHCGCGKFYDSVERWVSTARLFDPRTWFTGYWERKP